MSIEFKTPSVKASIARFIYDAKVVLGIYTDELPKLHVWPAAVIASVSKIPQRSHSGKSGMARSRAQVDCYDRTTDEVETTARAVITALEAQRGDGIRSIAEVNQRPLPHPNLRRLSIDFEVWHDDPMN